MNSDDLIKICSEKLVDLWNNVPDKDYDNKALKNYISSSEVKDIIKQVKQETAKAILQKMFACVNMVDYINLENDLKKNGLKNEKV